MRPPPVDRLAAQIAAKDGEGLPPDPRYVELMRRRAAKNGHQVLVPPDELPPLGVAGPRISGKEADPARRKSHYRGPTWNGYNWTVFVYVPGEGTKYAGRYFDEMEAARAHDRKARELLGDRAKLNFPDEAGSPAAITTPDPTRPASDPADPSLESFFEGRYAAPRPAPAPPVEDREVAALAAVAGALAALDRGQRARVLGWAAARFGSEAMTQ